MSRQGSDYIYDCEKSFKSIERLLLSHKNFIINQRKKLRQNDYLLKKVRQNVCVQKLPTFEDRYRSVQNVRKNADVHSRTNETQNKINQHQNVPSNKDNMFRSCYPKISRKEAGPLNEKKIGQKNNGHPGRDNISVEIRKHEIDKDYHEGGTTTHLEDSSLAKSRNYLSRNIYYDNELKPYSDTTNINVLDRYKRHHHYIASVDFMEMPTARSIKKLNLLSGQVKHNEDIKKGPNVSSFLRDHQSKYSGGKLCDWGSTEDEGNRDRTRTLMCKEPKVSNEIVERELGNRNEQDPKILEIAKLIVNYFQNDPITFDEKTVRQNTTKYRGRKNLYSLQGTPHAKDHKTPVANERLNNGEYDYRYTTESEFATGKPQVTGEPQVCLPDNPLRSSNTVNITCKAMKRESKPNNFHVTSHAKDYNSSLTNERLNNRENDYRNTIESEFINWDSQVCLQDFPLRKSNTVNISCKDMVGESKPNKYHVTSHAKDYNTLVTNERLFNQEYDYGNNIESECSNREPKRCLPENRLRNSNTVNITCKDMVEASEPDKYIEAYLDNSKQKSRQSLPYSHTRATVRLREGSVRLENQLPLYDENAHLLGYLKEGTQIIGPSCPQSLDRSLFENDFNNTQSKHCKFTVCNKANRLNSGNSTKPCVRWTYGSDFTSSVQHELVKAKFRKCPNCERCNGIPKKTK